MPNIPTYDQPNIGLTPTETGIQATTQAAYRGRSLYDQAAGAIQQAGREIGSGIASAGAAAVQAEAHQEISAGTKHGADIIAGLDDQWNKIVNDPKFDPNDRGAAQKFLEENVEPTLEDFQKGFLTEQGQQYAEQFSDRLRQHLFTKTAADMSRMAGQAIVSNYQGNLDSLSVAVTRDPSTLDFALDTLDHSLDAKIGTSPTLSSEDAIRVKGDLTQKGREQLVRAAAFGAIQKNPDIDLTQFEGRYAADIRPGEIETFQTAANGYKRIAESEARSARVDRDYQARNQFNQAANDLEISTLPQSAGAQPTLPPDYWDKVRSLANMPGAQLDPSRLKAMVANGETLTTRLGKPEPLGPVSHAATMDLLGQIRNGQMADNGPIYQAYGADKLSNSDFKFLMDEFANARTPDGQQLNASRKLFMDRYSKLIDGAMTDTGVPSLLGTQRLYAFEMDAQRAEADLRRAGKDPSLVYDPSSAYFFGNPPKLAAYHVSQQQAQQYDAKMKAADQTNEPPSPTATRSTPGPIVRQNGHTYQRQPDGSYKAIN